MTGSRFILATLLFVVAFFIITLNLDLDSSSGSIIKSVLAAENGESKDGTPNFKKMKVKQLKAWLSERSLSCPDCADKDSLVQFCIKEAKKNPKVTRPKPPAGVPFWDVWSNNAREICAAQLKKLSLVSSDEGKKVCDAIAVAVDGFFMQHGKRTAAKLKKNADALLKTSYGEIYYNAGRRLITRLIKYCLDTKHIGVCSSSSHIEGLMENEKVPGAPFMQYMTNIGIENTNPMYDIVKDKKGLDRDEL